MPEPLDVVREAFEAFGEGDIGAALALVAEDVEWDNRGSQALGLEQVYHGHEGLMTLLTGIMDVFDEYELVDPEYEAAGERVLIVAREFGRGLSSGVGDDRPLAIVYTVRDGKVVHVSTHADVEEGRARFAAGD